MMLDKDLFNALFNADFTAYVYNVKFCDDMVARKAKAMKDAKIYVNNETVVMKVGNEVYKATPEKGERFDVEKGILVCLAKFCGFSTTDILKLVKSANVQSPKKKKAKAKKK